jgi:hypothetical protein
MVASQKKKFFLTILLLKNYFSNDKQTQQFLLFSEIFKDISQ